MKKILPSIVFSLAFSVSTVLAQTTYTVDQDKSEVSFHYKQMGVGMEGHFSGLQGEIHFDVTQPEQMSAVLELPLSSVETGNDEANEELEKENWFHIDNYPVARFESTKVTPKDEENYVVEGLLEIKGQTQKLNFPVLVNAIDDDTLQFEVAFDIDRSNFEIGAGSWSDPSIVANEVTIQADVIATKK